jgi:hypothetical protein
MLALAWQLSSPPVAASRSAVISVCLGHWSEHALHEPYSWVRETTKPLLNTDLSESGEGLRHIEADKTSRTVRTPKAKLSKWRFTNLLLVTSW